MRLPEELILHVFLFLEIKDLVLLSNVFPNRLVLPLLFKNVCFTLKDEEAYCTKIQSTGELLYYSCLKPNGPILVSNGAREYTQLTPVARYIRSVEFQTTHALTFSQVQFLNTLPNATKIVANGENFVYNGPVKELHLYDIGPKFDCSTHLLVKMTIFSPQTIRFELTEEDFPNLESIYYVGITLSMKKPMKRLRVLQTQCSEDALIAISKMPQLEEVSFVTSVLSELDLDPYIFPESYSNIRTLAISRVFLDTVSLAKVPNLESLELSCVYQSSNINFCQSSKLKRVKIDTARMGTCPVLNCPNVEEVELRACHIEDMATSLKDCDHLKVLRLDLNNLEEILFALNSLKELSIQGNSLTHLKLPLFPELKKLFLSENPLKKIESLVGCPFLEELDLNECHLSDLRFVKNLRHLKQLKMCKNSLTQVDLSIITKNIELLDFSGNKISKVFDTRDHPFLKEVNFDNNRLKLLLPFHHLSGLKKVSILNNEIQTIEGLDRMTGLEELNLENNKILEIKGLAHQKSLKELNLSSNPLLKLENIEHLTLLQSLRLLDTEISIIDGDVLRPLKTLRKIEGTGYLKELVNFSHLPIQSANFSSNWLTTINGVHDLPNIRTLTLERNSISEIVDSFYNMPNILHLDLSYNNLRSHAICGDFDLLQPLEILVRENPIPEKVWKIVHRPGKEPDVRYW